MLYKKEVDVHRPFLTYKVRMTRPQLCHVVPRQPSWLTLYFENLCESAKSAFNSLQ